MYKTSQHTFIFLFLKANTNSICQTMKQRILLSILLLLFIQPLFAQTLLSEEDLEEERVYKNLEKALKKPSEVYILDLSGQGLDKIPRDIGRFRRLQILKLTNNNLGELPREMTRLVNLQILYLDSNNFNTINFDVSNPRFYSNLEQIYLGFNPLRNIPEDIKKLELVMVSLAGNKRLDLSQAFTPLAAISSLESLDLSYLKLDTVPWEVANIENLKTLNLSGNPSCEWDTSFRFLSQVATIEKLILQENKLRSISEEIVGLDNIIELDLSHNERLNARQVLKTILPLKKLEVLDFSYCELDELPKTIGEFSLLKELNISNNKITILPYEIKNLEEVEFLNLSFNELTELPSDISYMQSLEKLLIGHNPLEFLPKDIADLHELEYIELPEGTMDKTEKKNVRKYLPEAEIVFIEGDDN
ncbi:MAG: hypothetical protein DRI84_08455 [Bacteroidetes bacterium]|nr:MAG: hypothetical protein DRI84_08455 [Bacteroidota bacterium]